MVVVREGVVVVRGGVAVVRGGVAVARGGVVMPGGGVMDEGTSNSVGKNVVAAGYQHIIIIIQFHYALACRKYVVSTTWKETCQYHMEVLSVRAWS